jgi:hypothetical protein
VATTVYTGSPGIPVNARYDGGTGDEVSWSLEGPGTLSQATGRLTTYLPPGEGSAEARATVTATAGVLRASMVIDVLSPPFTVRPSSLTVTAGDGMIPILIVSKDPTRPVSWSYSLDGPGNVDDWYAPPEILYYPPETALFPVRATVHLFSMEYPYARDVPIAILPPPSPAGLGHASILRNGAQQSGQIRGWADKDGAGVYLVGPSLLVEPSDWPRVEGPADLVASCVQDAWSVGWDSCSFHFTEMMLGDAIYPGQTGGTWYFHGTFQATQNAGTASELSVRATF